MNASGRGLRTEEGRPADRHEGRVGVVVCRGCCCGNQARDPDTDHEAQLRRLDEMADARPDRLEVRTSECLGPCAQANVIVVRPSRVGRRLGGRPVWLAFVRDSALLEILDGWLSVGGPGLVPMPGQLDLHTIGPPGIAGRTRR